MNRLDQQEPTGHNGDPMSLERVKQKAVAGFAAFTGWMSKGKDRLTGQFKRLTDPERKLVHRQLQAIKPVRVEPAEPSSRDHVATHPETRSDRPEATGQVVPTVQRIEVTAPVMPIEEPSPVDEAPDRTFERNRQPDRPDLYHVTPGKPSLIEDTAVHEIVDESTLAAADETMIVPVVGRSQTDSPQSQQPSQKMAASSEMDVSDRPSVRLAAGSAPIPAREPVTLINNHFLERYLPGVSSFLSYYRKRRKADRAIRRNSRERVYRLKGYTTVAKVNRKRQSEKKQRLLRRVLIGIIAILTLVILFQIYNPFKDLSEWYRILGFDSLDELTQTTTNSTTSSSGQIIVTAPTTVSTGSTTSTAAR